MGKNFRIRMRLRRFTRRHPWLVIAVRSFMIFSAAFGGAYGFIAGSRSDQVPAIIPTLFAIGASLLFAIACVGARDPEHAAALGEPAGCASSCCITRRWPTAIGN